jgi:hypothetical protein
MTATSANYGAASYDLRSLNHERRMLASYRRKVSNGEAAFVQPLANSCWRSASFEWALYHEAETVRRLWGEAARTLAEGFTHRRPGFDPSPDQLILALHFAIAARERDAFTHLAMTAPNLREGRLHNARAYRNSRAHFNLAEGYALVARALVERQASPARAAVQALEAARHESDRGWWERQFPDPLDAAWRVSEHEAICVLLGAVARRIEEGAGDGDPQMVHELDELSAEFANTVEDTLIRLKRFVDTDADHHPKLYVWLPGLALCALAASAGLPLEWLNDRRTTNSPLYARLPADLVNRH